MPKQEEVSNLLNKWNKELENAANTEKDWIDEATKYFQIYRDEKSIIDGFGNESSRYNIFWANVQTLKPLVFSKLPNPNITRRFLDDNDNYRIISEMIERSISYFLDRGNVDVVFGKTRDDFLIGGRGIARVVFDEAEIVEIEEKTINENGEEVLEKFEEVDETTKKPKIEYWNWKDVRMSPEEKWEDVRWVAFRHKMTRDQLVENFGKIGNDVALNYSSLSKLTDSSKDGLDQFKLAEVWEIWDKETKRVLFISDGLDGKVLKDEEDNYNLEGFFPIAKPLGSDSDPCSLVPIPMYRMYKSQAEELNRIDARIKSLVGQMKFTGVYSSISEDSDIDNFLNGNDGTFSPLKSLTPGSSIRDSIFIKPIVEIANVINQLNDQKARVIQNIRDITGLSDIVRGTTLASETATAQRLKGDFAISRIFPVKREFEIFVRDTIRLLVELIVENYTAKELAKITGLEIINIKEIQKATLQKQAALFDEAIQQLNPNDPEVEQKVEQLNQQQQAGFEATMKPFIDKLKGYAVTPEQLEEIDAIIKDDKLRSFAVDIETDSTVSVDQNQTKQDRLEYMQAISAFFSQATPILQAGGINKATFREMLAFISSPFKVGRNLEEHLLSEEEEPKGPSLEEQMAQAENQRKDQELQLKAQEVNIKQQEVDVKKAQVKVGMVQFDDKLELEDVHKTADREAKTFSELVNARTQRLNNTINESF